MDSVTENEKALKQWKEETRREALENEVERLKSQTTCQAAKIRRLTIAFFAAIAALIVTLGAIWILSSEHDEYQPAIANQTAKEEGAPEIPPSQKNRELNIVSPISDTIKFRIPENGIIFSIQIGAYLSHDLQKFDDNMISLHQYSSENINQFTIGLFTNYTKALEFKDMVKQLGLTDAYVTALKNGKRIPMQEAIQGSTSQEATE